MLLLWKVVEQRTSKLNGKKDYLLSNVLQLKMQWNSN